MSQAGGTAPTDPAADDGGSAGRRRILSPRVRIQWGLGVVARIVGLTGLAVALAAWTGAVPPRYAAAAGVVLVGMGLAWVQRRYQAWAFEVRADGLYLERGVVTHVRTIAPYVRIQHVDTRRGPLERLLGLSTLVVYTAGSRGADVAIPGLTPDEARDLQGRVKRLAIEAGGGDAV